MVQVPVLLLAALASGQPRGPRRGGPAHRPAPWILLLGRQPAAVRLLVRSLEVSLRETGVSVRTAPLSRVPRTTQDKFRLALEARAPGLVAVCWCERDPDTRRDFMNLVDVRSKRLVVREVGRCDEPEGAESAAIIVQAAVESILATQGPTRRHKRPRPSHGRPPRPRPGSPHLRHRPRHEESGPSVTRVHSPVLLEVFYRGDFPSRDKLYANAAGLGVAFRIRKNWRLFADFWIREPLEGATSQVAVKAYGYGIGLFGGRYWRWDRWEVGALAGLAAMVYDLEISEEPGIVASQDRARDFEVVAETGGSAAWRVTGGVWIRLRIGVQAPLYGLAGYYVQAKVQTPSGPSTNNVLALSFLPVRPFLSLVVSLAAL